MKIDEVEVYKQYLATKGEKGETVSALAERLGVARQRVYDIIKKVEEGNEVRLERCLMKTRYDCIWTHRYEQRFLVIGNGRDEDTMVQLRSLIRDMHADGFGVRNIARRICKDASTVLHHLNSK